MKAVAPAPGLSRYQDLFRTHKDGLSVDVRLTPKASSNKIEGITKNVENEPLLKARVTAVPENGKANDALLKLLAKAWSLSRTTLRITSGTKHRNKTIIIAGPRDTLESQMRLWLNSLQDGEDS